MPTLIETAGAANANTYCSLATADAYFEDLRLHDAAWASASDDDKETALIWATQILDENCNWNGKIGSDTQRLRWPRSYIYTPDGISVDSDIIPEFLQHAAAEFAFHLLQEDRTLESNRDLKGFEKLKVGPIYMQIDQYTSKPVMPPSVWSKLKFYCTKYGSNKTLVRM